MEKTCKEYLEEILCSKISDDLTGAQKQALDAVTELLGFCDYERLCELAKADKDGKYSVIHAQWVIDRENRCEKIAHCSHCGKRPVEKKYAECGCGYVIYHCYAILTDFCPNCAAKMDGETK